MSCIETAASELRTHWTISFIVNSSCNRPASQFNWEVNTDKLIRDNRLPTQHSNLQFIALIVQHKMINVTQINPGKYQNRRNELHGKE